MITDNMETHQTNLSLAIWELSYNQEKKAYKDLIVKKALRLKDLEAKDLFAMPETEAKSITRQIEYLTSELDILYGVKLFTDQLEKSYLNSIDQIFDAYHNQNLLLEIELFELNKSFSFLQELHVTTIESLSFMTDLAIKKIEQIITLKQSHD